MNQSANHYETHPIENGILSRLRRGGLWIVAGRSLGMGTVFLITMVLAKFLPEKDFASYIVTASLVTLTSILAMFGLNYLMCRLVASSLASESQGTAKSRALKIGGVAILSIFLFATLFLFASRSLFHFLGAGELTYFVWAIAAWIVGLSISQIIAETFRGIHNLFAASILAGVSGGLLANSILLTGIVILILNGQLTYSNVVILAPCSFAPAILLGLIWLPLAWPKTSETPNDRPVKPLSNTMTGILREALPIMMLNLSAYGIDQAGQLIAKGFGDDIHVNTFESVWKLGFLMIVPLTMLGLAAASTISEQHAVQNRSLLQKVLRSVSTISFIVSCPLFLILAFFGGPILSILFKEAYASGASALLVLITVQMIRNWAGPCDIALVMTGHPWWAFLCFVLAAPVLFLGPWAISNHGVLGMTIVISLALLISRLGHYVVLRHQLQVSSHANLQPVFLTGLIRSALHLPTSRFSKETLPDKAS